MSIKTSWLYGKEQLHKKQISFLMSGRVKYKISSYFTSRQSYCTHITIVLCLTKFKVVKLGQLSIEGHYS